MRRSPKLPDKTLCRTEPYSPRTKKGIFICLVENSKSCPYSLGFDSSEYPCRFCYHDNRDEMSRREQEYSDLAAPPSRRTCCMHG